MAKAVVPTTEYIESLKNKGDINELQRLNEMLAKRSNERLRQLEKYDLYGTAAYNRAKSFIDKSTFAKNNRFSRSKKMDIDSLFDQVKQEANFLRWQTSTVAGELERRENIFNSLFVQHIDEASGDIVNPPLDLPSGVTDLDAFKKSFLDFLDTNAWEEMKKFLYHKDILNEAGRAIASGAKVEDLKQALDDYHSKISDTDRFTIWDNWTKVTEQKEPEKK